MKNLRLNDCVGFLCFTLLLCLFAAGCTKRAPQNIVTPNSAPIVAGVQFTEATVLGEIADVRLALKSAVDASVGLPSEPTVRAAAEATETSIAKIEAALKEHPAADVEKLVAEFHIAINQLREVIKQRDAEIVELKNAEWKFWLRILIGIGVGASLAAGASTAVGFYAITIPIIGPALGRHLAVLLAVLAGVCFLLAYLASWARAHEKIAGGIVIFLIAAIIGIAWVNVVNHRRELRAANVA